MAHICFNSAESSILGVKISKLKPSESDLAVTGFAGFYLLKESLSERLEKDAEKRFPEVIPVLPQHDVPRL